MVILAASASYASLWSIANYKAAADLCGVSHIGTSMDNKASPMRRALQPGRSRLSSTKTQACLHFAASPTRRRTRRRRNGGGSSDDDEMGGNDNNGWNGGSGGSGSGGNNWSSGGWSGGWEWSSFSLMVYESTWLWQLLCAGSLLQALHFAILGNRKSASAGTIQSDAVAS